jgi:hypothetical protein
MTRIYSGFAYSGPTSNDKPAEYKTLVEAQKARDDFDKRNPVGWNIWDSETLKLIEGTDHFQ